MERFEVIKHQLCPLPYSFTNLPLCLSIISSFPRIQEDSKSSLNTSAWYQELSTLCFFSIFMTFWFQSSPPPTIFLKKVTIWNFTGGAEVENQLQGVEYWIQDREVPRETTNSSQWWNWEGDNAQSSSPGKQGCLHGSDSSTIPEVFHFGATWKMSPTCFSSAACQWSSLYYRNKNEPVLTMRSVETPDFIHLFSHAKVFSPP